jgi:hypothetical protein
MRKRKQPGGYGEVPCRSFRPEVTVCPTCQRQLRRYATLPERTVITLTGPFRLSIAATGASMRRVPPIDAMPPRKLCKEESLKEVIVS